MPATSETCKNCGRAIDERETPRVHDDHVLCADCWYALSGAEDEIDTLFEKSCSGLMLLIRRLAIRGRLARLRRRSTTLCAGIALGGLIIIYIGTAVARSIHWPDGSKSILLSILAVVLLVLIGFVITASAGLVLYLKLAESPSFIPEHSLRTFWVCKQCGRRGQRKKNRCHYCGGEVTQSPS